MEIEKLKKSLVARRMREIQGVKNATSAESRKAARMSESEKNCFIADLLSYLTAPKR